VIFASNGSYSTGNVEPVEQRRVDAHADAARVLDAQHFAPGGQEAVGRILGVDAAFHRMAAKRRRLFRDCAAARDLELQAHEVGRRHELGYGMLDLEARVHLEEIEFALAVDDELHRPGAAVAHRRRQPHGRSRHLLAQLGRHERRGRFLDDLLVAALHGALALAEVDGAALAVAEDLHLDVARLGHVLFEVDAVVAERGARLALRRRDRLVDLGGRAHQAHAASAAACRGFHQNGQAERLRGRAYVAGQRSRRDHRQAALLCEIARADLVAHLGDRIGRRAHERHARALYCARELRVLGEEAVAGMHRVGSRAARGFDDAPDVEVARRRRVAAERLGTVGEGDVCGLAIGIGIDRDGLDAHLARRAHDAAGDFGAVGDEQAFDRTSLGQGPVSFPSFYMRNTPKRVSSMGRTRDAASASPRTLRVSAGSMTPSSHKRAVL
jgi:hypothetical protein